MSDLVARQTEFAAHYSLTYDEYKLLAHSCTSDELITCLELLKAKKHRSPYRARLAQAIREWLVTQNYTKPLSHWQFKNAVPTWPVHHNIPV